jgi:selenocysteine lyase/cysteine desulfurase
VAHAAGARVVVDAAQLAPHRGIDLRTCGADYVAFSGHKLYAPFGTGALVGRRDWLDVAAPHLRGGAVRDVREEATDWLPAPRRHEAGTPNLLGAVALAAACHALCALPTGALEAHEERLRAQLLAGRAAADHAVRDGHWAPVGDDRDLSAWTGADSVAPAVGCRAA